MARLRSLSLVIAVSLVVPLWAIPAVHGATFAATAPDPRAGVGMVYDAAHGVTLLFGGSDNQTYFKDTWAWNGSRWTALHPATSPAGRALAGMAYDEAHGQVVLFGGIGAGFELLGDTWTWAGTTWT